MPGGRTYYPPSLQLASRGRCLPARTVSGPEKAGGPIVPSSTLEGGADLVRKGRLENSNIMALELRAAGALALSLCISVFASACAAPTDADESGDQSEETSEAFTAVNPHFAIKEAADGQFYFRLVAGNEQTVLSSEGYSRKASAESGIASVVANGADEGAYEVREAADGRSYFVLTAANHEVIGMSQLYASKYNAQRGIRSVRTIVARMQRDGVRIN